jgi:hypothetical protein
MNNLFKIILQSWQIAKNNKLLWIFSAGYAFSILISNFPTNKPSGDATWNNFFLLCFGCTSSLLVLFISTFSLYGLIYCSGVALCNIEVKFSQVWMSFKANIFKLFLLGIFLGIYFFGLFALIFLLRQVSISLVGYVFSEAFLTRAALETVAILLGTVIFLSPCGMIFEEMGAFQSFWNGLKIFSTGWASFVGLVLLFDIPRLVMDIFAINAILATGQILSYANYQGMIKTFPYQWITIVISFFVNPVSYLSILKIYFDLTTAKNNGENLQTVVTPKT